MGFLSPSVPEAPKVSAPAKADVNRQEAGKVAKVKERRKRSNSSYANSIRGGAVNPSYATGTKTAQGQ